MKADVLTKVESFDTGLMDETDIRMLFEMLRPLHMTFSRPVRYRRRQLVDAATGEYRYVYYDPTKEGDQYVEEDELDHDAGTEYSINTPPHLSARAHTHSEAGTPLINDDDRDRGNAPLTDLEKLGKVGPDGRLLRDKNARLPLDDNLKSAFKVIEDDGSLPDMIREIAEQAA